MGHCECGAEYHHCDPDTCPRLLRMLSHKRWSKEEVAEIKARLVGTDHSPSESVQQRPQEKKCSTSNKTSPK